MAKPQQKGNNKRKSPPTANTVTSPIPPPPPNPPSKSLTKPPPSTEQITTNTPSQNYASVFKTRFLTRDTIKHLHTLDAEGYIFLTLWPLLLSHASQSTSSEAKVNTDEISFLIAAILVATDLQPDIVSKSQIDESSGMLNFLTNAPHDASAWETFYVALLSPSASSTPEPTNVPTLKTQTTLKFLAMLHPLSTSSSPSLACVRSSLRSTFSSPSLLSHLPESLREYALVKDKGANLKSLYDKREQGTNAVDHSKAFHALTLQFIFHISTSTSSSFPNNNNNSANTFDYSPLYLSLLIDLLSTLSTRKWVLPYVLAMGVIPAVGLSHLLLPSTSIAKGVDRSGGAGGGSEDSGDDSSSSDNDDDDQGNINKTKPSTIPLLLPTKPNTTTTTTTDTDTTISLLTSLLSTLTSYTHFPLSPSTSLPLTPLSLESLENQKLYALQRLAHKHFSSKLTALAFQGVGVLRDEEYLLNELGTLDGEEVVEFCQVLRLFPLPSELQVLHKFQRMLYADRRYALALITSAYVPVQTQNKTVEALPIFPDEKTLWDPFLVPSSSSSSSLKRSAPTFTQTLSLPKLTTQFLSTHDYLYRSYQLYRLESAYDVRGDIVDVINRLNPQYNLSTGKTTFKGWAKMGVLLPSLGGDNAENAFSVTSVGRARLGEVVPSKVEGVLVVDYANFSEGVRREWEELREFECLFLVAVDAVDNVDHVRDRASEDNANDNAKGKKGKKAYTAPDADDPTFALRKGVKCVRGCEIVEVKDSSGTLLNDPSSQSETSRKPPVGTVRYIKVLLDASQYYRDAQAGQLDVYSTFNVVVRRKGKENNFKPVLATIRALMRDQEEVERSIPSWLRETLLGFGEPSAANYNSVQMREWGDRTAGVNKWDMPVDFADAFLSDEHVREAFRGKEVTFEDKRKVVDREGRACYRVKFTSDSKVVATKHAFTSTKNKPGNQVKFTCTQISAIRSGTSPGLTVLVGPPGTGKTDVAVQIVANLYRAFPDQKVLLVTHSNAALNDLFVKIMERGDLDERYMLRLGAGEKDLNQESTHDFTKWGRVNFTLARRLELLGMVQDMAESLGVSGRSERGPRGESSYSCESASFFLRHHVSSRIRAFEAAIANGTSDTNVEQSFPFTAYFSLPHLNSSHPPVTTLEEASSCFLSLRSVFSELEEFRAFELLRSTSQRTDYLLTKQAKIVAMTCTHAALSRARLIDLGFNYDTVVVEEAGQMLEIETFLPLLLQRSADGEESRLKRVCLIGDHKQLPPVVKNMQFAKHGNLEQSMFTRLVKLGVPTVTLDKQGRARPEIAKLYSWRYPTLGNLPNVMGTGTGAMAKYNSANAGFKHTFQLIDVQDYEGRGEVTPTPFFYQNLGEAEMVVATFQYMVLIGYPPHKISILTTYNGQKELICDVLSRRCGPNTPLANARPGKVSTVDQYQGQQNDYILLSLVRTKDSVGHLRDVRRLIVAVSRARLGLYVFCREEIFRKCKEIKVCIEMFGEGGKGKKLDLIAGEGYGTGTENGVIDRKSGEEAEGFVVEDVGMMGQIVYELQGALLKNMGVGA